MVFSFVLKLLAVFPPGLLYRVADILSVFITLIPNRTSRLILKNIRMCFPDLDPAEQKRLHRSTIKHFCYSIFELPAIWCWSAEKILARITQVEVCDSFEHSNKARIIIAPHLGSWELLNLWLAQETDFLCLYKPVENSSIDKFLLDSRSRNGARLLPVNSAGFRQLSIGLREGKTAMILPDQRPRKDKAQLMSRFFGHDAPTTPLVHNLCRRVDCDVFIATVVRNRSQGSFRLHIKALEHGNLAADQQQSLDYMNKEIEELIKQYPEQYQWGYSRFGLAEYHLADLY